MYRHGIVFADLSEEQVKLMKSISVLFYGSKMTFMQLETAE